MPEVAFSLGSSLGDCPTLMREARRRLVSGPGITEVGASSIYETSPVDVPPEFASTRFLNAVLVLDGPMDAYGWFKLAHNVESALDRVRDGRRNVPRTIDVDLLYCGDEVVSTQDLQVPHPRWHLRRFVLEPLAEVRPAVIPPGSSSTVWELLQAYRGDEVVRKTDLAW